jgi:hypothetical protein
MARGRGLSLENAMKTSLSLRPGEVAILRTCDASGKVHESFQWPLEVGAEVVAPDWIPKAKCGHGLHGLMRGAGDGTLLNWLPDAKWLVVAAIDAECVDLYGKVKFPRCRVLHVGDQASATALLASIYHGVPIVGVALTGGYGSTLTGGYGSKLTGGDYSTLTGGYGSKLTGGDYSTLTGGDYSTLTGGDYSTLTGGYGSKLTGGYGSTLTGGDRSTLSIQWWDGERIRIAVAYVGEDAIESNVPYRVRDGEFVRAEVAK